VDIVDSYNWIEGWKSTELATLYYNEFVKFNVNYAMWLDAHKQIHASGRPLSSDEWLKREKQSGIRPPALSLKS
jgi:hypothetical protein